MPDGQSLEFSGVTKRFGAVTAVADLSARVEPGRVTGFLGPNGAGKTTTLRILLGLVRASGGHATIGGRRYAELDRPLQTVGAVLEASSFHPGRTGAAHLTIYAQAAGIPRGRVDEVLGLVGLGDAGGRKVAGYSLGMRQRLGLAYALLGDPGVLVLDEPANGLDPEGIRWMRGFLRQLAAEGRTVLISSHLLAEVQQTVDALLILSRGRLVFEGSIDDLADPSEFATVVDAPDRDALTAALTAAELPFEVLRSGLTVRGADPVAVGAAAAAAGVALSSLQRRGPALEEVFLDLVNGTRVHASAAGGVVAMAPVVTTDEEPMDAADAPDPSVEADESDEQPHAEALAAEAAPAAAGVALAAGGTVPLQDDDAEPHAEAEDQEADDREAGESALSAAELDAEATGAPGAAAALGAAAGATWAAERDAEPEDPDDAETIAEPAEPAEPTASDAASEPAVTTGAGFAVASTGVIDIVPPAAAEAVPPDQAATDAPEDSDPDVEELGTIDDELSAPEPPDADDDRPWENYVKTEADVEADAFFSSFDTGESGDGSEPEHEPTGPGPADSTDVSSSGTGAPSAQRPGEEEDTAGSLSERSDMKRPDETTDPGPDDPGPDEEPGAAASTPPADRADEGGGR
ncbi:ATP-binding cassette domain-containing protein [Microbacterium sp. NEAU-LLC]|uniref:ATP-binding cassette domain-containing protein n=1 Tax=Microbacterium helvum TaxID=2773713 RepID=A0ABR8NNE2_9MICO|nr:ATP-binding cassette domain-containing protein [Microbacterium helvum]MBD3942175.1 ATP-binding cassette domain-containing protein [Microbacterium helvum]